MRCIGITAIALVVVALAAPGRGQDAVNIKIAYPQPGQRVKMIVDDKANQKASFVIGGQPQTAEDVREKSLVYTDEILENPKNEARATKMKRTYEKARITEKGKPVVLDVEGKTVLIEKSGEAYKFTVDGKALTGDSQKLLSDEFGKGDKKDPRQVMLPKGAVKPGETWKIDVAELVKMMGPDGPQLAKDKVVATGKLVKTYQQGGKQFGVVEYAVDAPITGLGAKDGFTVKDGKLTLTMNGDGCIDGTSPSGKTETGMKFIIAGTSSGIDVKVDVDLKESRTIELLPAK